MLVWALLSGCASLLTRTASEEEQRAYDAALAQIDTDPAAARQALEALIANWPSGPLVDDAEFALGEVARREGDEETALRHFQRVADGYPGSDRADAARVRIAQIRHARGDAAGARSILGRVRSSRLEGAELRDAYRVLAEVAPDPVARLRWLALLRAETGDEKARDAIDVEIDAVVTGLDAASLERAARQLGERPPAARVQLASAELALEAGELEAARAALARAQELSLPARYAPRFAAASERLRLRQEGPTQIARLPTFAEAMRAGMPDTTTASGSIGVVLPLTGPFARFGEESLQGVLLAARTFGPLDGGASNVRVMIRDSGGDPQRAAAAVQELAQDALISAIVGPLLSSECEAAAAVAEREGVPLLALAAREAIAADRPHVFRLQTRPSEDVELLVDRARALGAERFAVLYRNDAYGRGLRSLFWDAVEERGGQLVGIAAYDPQATDFAEPIRRLVGYALLTGEENKLLAEREEMLRRARRVSAEESFELRQRASELETEAGDPLPPIVDFDALFIPDSHENVVLIAAQLAFHEVVGTQLLGPDGWYDEDLVRLGRDQVAGALFTAHFYPDSPVPYVHQFTVRYEETFGRRPGVFAAQAYDAANLVLSQMARGRQRRESVRKGVLAIQGYPGVSGVISMGSDGNAHKRPYLLGVQRGRVVQYDD
ncbi:MAG: penicillin-binding protein activator [Myxococcales bacterium]|nr:penicillin-binding protein activator [Myxococcales bacterium]MDH5306565.1 penicillin-binding protein activator [Myxococcales bacterium]MDH5567749.1 penicillin-binding protein activator [Myxococcales bacterium]